MPVKVLIAEDDPTTRAVLKKLVEGANMSAITCSDGARAYQILEENTDFSLLITDISMPNMDGRQLIKTLRSHKSLNELPIFVLSGVVTPNEISGLLELGASKFLPKPINAQEIKDYLSRHYKKMMDKSSSSESREFLPLQ